VPGAFQGVDYGSYPLPRVITVGIKADFSKKTEKMKKLIQFLAMISFVAVSWGCKESFLELAPVSNPNADNFYKTKQISTWQTNAAYNTLYTVYHPQGPVSYAGELMSDNVTIYNISGNQADKWQFRDYSLAPANTMVYQFWQDFYKSLYNINIILDKIQSADLDALTSLKYRGKCFFCARYTISIWHSSGATCRW
jgi:hypothetical protein